jgi:hypothetical protein
MDIHERLGVVLRLPIVLALTVVWLCGFWWWIAGIGVGLSLFGLVLRVAWFPPWYLYRSLGGWRGGSPADYWYGFPERYFELCGRSLTLGFGTLIGFLSDGFGF